MRERPIIFSGPMVRQILAGQKTQTRRMVKFRDLPTEPEHHNVWRTGDGWQDGDEPLTCPYGRPGDRLYVKESFHYHSFYEGGHVRVRYAADGATSGHLFPNEEELDPDKFNDLWAEHSDAMYDAGYVCDDDTDLFSWPYADRPKPETVGRLRPSIFMPRWASRLTLEVVSVRVERLQEVTEEDALAECVRQLGPTDFVSTLHPVTGSYQRWPTGRVAFEKLWDSINGRKPGRAWADDPWVWAITFTRVES